MGWLVLGAMLAQSLANAGPLAVQVLADPSEEGQAGRFLSALVLARLSLYLFQAVQATLLPNVAVLVAASRVTELNTALRRLTRRLSRPRGGDHDRRLPARALRGPAVVRLQGSR